MLNKFIDFEAIRKDMRQLGVFTILAGLVGLFLPGAETGAYHLWGAASLIVLGLGFWLSGVYKPHPP